MGLISGRPVACPVCSMDCTARQGRGGGGLLMQVEDMHINRGRVREFKAAVGEDLVGLGWGVDHSVQVSLGGTDSCRVAAPLAGGGR